MHGKGIFKWANGNRYEGDYKEDKKDGTGIFYFADGKVYKGSWHHGK